MTLSRSVIFLLVSESSRSFYIDSQSFIYLCLIQFSSRNFTNLKNDFKFSNGNKEKSRRCATQIGDGHVFLVDLAGLCS